MFNKSLAKTPIPKKGFTFKKGDVITITNVKRKNGKPFASKDVYNVEAVVESFKEPEVEIEKPKKKRGRPKKK